METFKSKGIGATKLDKMYETFGIFHVPGSGVQAKSFTTYRIGYDWRRFCNSLNVLVCG